MNDRSYYHCQHCREDVSMEIQCPCCSLGHPESYPMSSNLNLFDEFFGWLKVHRLGREHLFSQMREKYDWGYIKACEVIEAELRRKLQEHKDGTDRIGRAEDLLV